MKPGEKNMEFTFAKTKSSDKKSGISGTFSFLDRYYFSI
jgi:hypothetical protein